MNEVVFKDTEDAEYIAHRIASGFQDDKYTLTIFSENGLIHWILQEKFSEKKWSGSEKPRQWANSVYGLSWRVE